MRLIDADAIPWTDLNADMPNSKIKVLVAFADKINRMPTIEPQRKKGKWIDCDGGIATCSICGDRWGVYGVMKFCPNCGAEMTEDSECLNT